MEEEECGPISFANLEHYWRVIELNHEQIERDFPYAAHQYRSNGRSRKECKPNAEQQPVCA